jgi:hypothetical protein
VLSVSRHRPIQFCLALLLCIAMTSTRLIAQANGTIGGVVVDASGAAVAGASVTVKNTSTGVGRTVTSDASGRYSVNNLGNGVYEITATAATFKTTSMKNIKLDIGQVLAEQLSLAAGGSTEEISVEAQAITTETETSQNAQVIGAAQVADLPLANRQFYNLVEVAPGVAPPSQGSSMGFRGGMNVNGAAETANMFTFNGTDNVDISTNQAVFRPSVDTIAEFKVITGVPSADYGRMNGGQIIIVSKQGGNKFHGSLYEYIRNGAIEARPWSPSAAPAGSKSPAFKQNTFGATVGGPILKDKAFFFFGYEGQRIRQEQTASQTVPTLAQQSGCETAATTNPVNTTPGQTTLAKTTTGACASVTGGGYDITTITDNSGNLLYNSTAATYGKLMAALAYPLPNQPTQANGSNYLFDETRRESMDEENSRFDYTISAKDSFNSSFNHFHDPSYEPNNSLCSSRSMPNFGCFTDQITWLFNVGEVHVINPNTVNNVVFGWNRLQQPRVQEDNTTIGSKWPGLPGVDNPSLTKNDFGLPSISVTGYTATGGQTNLPQNRWDNSFDFDETLTYTHKAHTFKAGVQFLFVKTTEYEVSNGRGNLAFNASSLRSANGTGSTLGTTNDSFADVLLGFPYTAAQTPTPVTFTPNVYNRYNSFDGFVMDDWKIKPYLTLNFGLRYELDLPETEKNGNFSTFSPSTPNTFTYGTGATTYTPGPIAAGTTISAGGIANPLGNFVVAKQDGQTTVYRTDHNNFAPRVGFAWQPFHNDKTVIKGAGGIFFTEPQAFNEMLNYGIQFPIRQAKTFTAGSYASGNSITLANPFPSAALPAPGTPFCVTGATGCNAFNAASSTPCANPCNLIPVVTGTDVNPHYSTPYVSQWTLGVQRQVTKSILAEVLYFGNKGTKIAFGCTANLNTNNLPDSHTLGQNYTTGTSTLTPNTNGVAGTPTSYTTYNSVSGSALQVLRKYPQWGAISFHTTGCNSYYHSLQSRVQVTTKAGISILATYTYGRAEDGLTAAQDPGKHAFDKGLSAFDVRNRFVLSPVIPLPFGKGRMFANSGLSSAIFGGFKVSGIYQIYSGRPLTISDSTSFSSASAGGDRPSLIPGQSLTSADPLGVGAVHNKNEWFNVHAITYNAPGTFGNLTPGKVIGPGFNQLDLTIGRIVPIKEWAKAEFKVDAFNLLNHPNLFSPLTTSGAVGATYSGFSTFISPATPVTPGYCAANQAAGSNQVTLNGNTGFCTNNPTTASGATAGFGTITQANPMREIQASVHITF